MVETDWREILSFSQRELMQADKEKLCESLSWMEADDIELNFTDLKTLFRLAQDILKYKSEQVNNLMGEVEKGSRKGTKIKNKVPSESIKSSDGDLNTITHQEEVINANKEIIKQLNSEIAKLEKHKNKFEDNKVEIDMDSESSRDPLSEMNATLQLENEIFKKNRHIRKLLVDVKLLEENNVKLKNKLSQLKDKLKEATQLIENLTEQLFCKNSESNELKETLAKCENTKIQIIAEIESLKKELNTKNEPTKNNQDDGNARIQYLKNSLRAQKNEIERLSAENTKLKENLILASKPPVSTNKLNEKPEEEIIKELQDKLIEASNKIEQSANLIQFLKTENKRLKSAIDDGTDLPTHENKNECDDGKEKNMIAKLRNKLKNVTAILQATEEIMAMKEKELADMALQLKLLKTKEGITTLLDGLKNKKRQIKLKDEAVKNLVIEINGLRQHSDVLQLENETLRQKLNIPSVHKVPIQGMLKKYRDLEQNLLRITKELKRNENKLVSVEMDNCIKNKKILKLTKLLNKSGQNCEKINEALENYEDDTDSEEGTIEVMSTVKNKEDSNSENNYKSNTMQDPEIQAIIKENEGLRVGLKEILDFLKDNSTTSSGILALKCPSLETICHSMDARHAAGWFAPHMTTVMELKAALGGKDALLSALHESRKEMFEVMTQLSKETEKSSQLEQKLVEIEAHNIVDNVADNIPHSTTNIEDIKPNNYSVGTDNIDYNNKGEVQNMILQQNIQYENQLKSSLNYFKEKFKSLLDKLNSLTITTEDNHNKWLIQEENYKAEIENLKSKVMQNVEDDTSIQSPGLLFNPDTISLQRKITYLEELYKHIRTQNENLKNEYSEFNREMMLMTSDYEIKVQNLILSNLNLGEQIRRCIPVDIFWKQNAALNELNTKYRNLTERFINNFIEKDDLLKRLDEDKSYILNFFQNDLKGQNEVNQDIKIHQVLEKSIYEKQLDRVASELETKNAQIEILKKKNEELQIASEKLIDNLMGAKDYNDNNFLEQQMYNLREENKIYKQENQRLTTELDISLQKLHGNQLQKTNTEMEINLLQHQILDLQSTGDNKAIIARLSSEILIAHLRSSENMKKIERLTLALNKEKHMKAEVEDKLQTRQKFLDYYIFSNDHKFRSIFEILQTYRREYQGSLPLCTVENYLIKLEDLNRKTVSITEKLDEIEDLRQSLMMKHSVYNQILETTNMQNRENGNTCDHNLKTIVTNKMQSHELDLCNTKIQALERSRKSILDRCNFLEQTLIIINNGHKILNGDNKSTRNTHKINLDMEASYSNMELEDIASDDETTSSKNNTFTVTKPKFDKTPEADVGINNQNENTIYKPEIIDVYTQTSIINEIKKTTKATQTDNDRINELQFEISNLNIEYRKETKKSAKLISEIQSLERDLSIVNEQKHLLEQTVQNLLDSENQKDNCIKLLQSNIKSLNTQMDDFKSNQYAQVLQEKNICNEENRSLLQTLKELENEKNSIIKEYKDLLTKDREDYAKSVKDLQAKLSAVQSEKSDGRTSNVDTTNEDGVKEAVNKYILRITELEDKCFKLQSNLDGCKTEILTCQSELDRWKDLANERLSKMEQLSAQLKERHNDEVETYKAENQHWLTQLNETQREHMDLRSRLTEQKTLYVKQLADKDAHIEQLRTVVHNLKTQIMNMQTMLSINDPSFDLSAIVEVEEASDAASPHGSERLELKYESVVDLQDFQEDYNVKMPSTSTTIWHEPLIERLRREKQLIGKQNAILRRQIKAVAARERRARLDAQNLKNQVFRITTSGNKVSTVESAALQNKVASLQTQLLSARRDAHSSVAIWDKWKRAQQAAERWQVRYEEKCQEEKKLETSLNLTKSALSRLEKEKRVLLSRLSEMKSEKSSVVEKQDDERSEKGTRSQSDYGCVSPPPVSTRALLDRIQAQQRRIAALEVAEKGNEPLVTEYEKSLAEITSLKGQVLKLESTLLESEIRTPLNPSTDSQPELEYWKSYCDMLKEENMQLTLRVNSLETTPTSSQQQRINDLEQTILTLRGLVSKLQADQKSGVVKRVDSRPSSGRSSTEKVRNQIESYRTEISNLKRTIQEKDFLLEKSKEMLKIAAEREEQLLRENSLLRRRFDELVERKGNFLSA